ncbi:DUF3310 domain-containing protein [Staphylococcus saprophyticus]|uniref:DUF3310 domain-containing protein n=1 Tax=Staphylococcus saprophyticus TaxID=29385 RepID=UPI0008532804|nr:DUF3310 domain-containing protein [Staphylococcus saprophyticus]MDW4367083.1 DUF3310 domain-containing protein [Staphylococcus saprophyticus]
MKIRDLKIGNYVVVNDLGAGKYSSGIRVIGKVVKIDPCGNSAIIESLPKHRYEITDFNDFELWSKQIENKTERMGLNNQSNDVQQRKRNDTVNHPSHYNYGDIEVIDFIEQVTKHYNPNVAYHIGNAIKYLARSPHKNGKEDVDKARWYIERAFENWDVK